MESISTGTRVGLVVNPARKRDYLSKFRELIESPPKRTGKPRNPSPSQMKKILKERLSYFTRLIQGLDTNILCYALDPAFPDNQKCQESHSGAFGRVEDRIEPNGPARSILRTILRLRMGSHRRWTPTCLPSESSTRRILQSVKESIQPSSRPGRPPQARRPRLPNPRQPNGEQRPGLLHTR